MVKFILNRKKLIINRLDEYIKLYTRVMPENKIRKEKKYFNNISNLYYSILLDLKIGTQKIYTLYAQIKQN